MLIRGMRKAVFIDKCLCLVNYAFYLCQLEPDYIHSVVTVNDIQSNLVIMTLVYATPHLCYQLIPHCSP